MLSKKLCGLVLFVSFLLLGGCTSVQSMPDSSQQLALVSGCNFVSHLKCIYLTGKETLQDGGNRKWTRHWFRMSYIGKACERQHGRTTAVILESLFAIPHYTLMAIGNGIAGIFSPFIRDNPVEIPEESVKILDKSVEVSVGAFEEANEAVVVETTVVETTVAEARVAETRVAETRVAKTTIAETKAAEVVAVKEDSE